MAELVACLHGGEVKVLRHGQVAQRLESPYREQLAAIPEGPEAAQIVSITRGRVSGELCYAVSGRGGSAVFAQVPGSGQEQRLFHSADTELSELDFSLADEALACTVTGEHGTSAIGVLSDDGKGVRTVTEGDVIDRAPRWAPGGRAEIVYASAGIGRTKQGRAVGRSPFALHRLRFSDNSVEVLMADAKHDYAAVVPVREDLLYALRREFDGTAPLPAIARISSAFRGIFSRSGRAQPRVLPGYELVRITPKRSELVARDVVAFDVAANEDIVYSNGAGVFGIAAGQSTPEPVLALERVEQLLIYW
jgi:hypothetical protein